MVSEGINIKTNEPNINKLVKAAVAIEFLFLIILLLVILKEVVQLIKKIESPINFASSSKKYEESPAA